MNEIINPSEIIDLSKFKSICDLFKSIVEDEEEIICQHCGTHLKTFNKRHFVNCFGSKEDYIREYGLPNLHYERSFIINGLVKQIYSLYISNNYKWLIFSNKYGYRTVNNEKLNFLNILAHLKGQYTVGVFPSRNNTSNFLVFDVDAYDSMLDAQDVVSKIKHFLKYYFPSEQIHVVFSGRKGYHITLYFAGFVEVSLLNRLFNIVLDEIGIERYQNLNVEMRPEPTTSETGRGIKLPLGFNFNNPDTSNNFCYFSDADFNMIENQIEYFLNIRKTFVSNLHDIISDYGNCVDIKDYRGAYKGKATEIQKIVSNETLTPKEIISNLSIIPGNRHHLSFVLALKLKHQSFPPEKVFQILYDWSIKELHNGTVKSTPMEIENDLNKIIEDVFSSESKYKYTPRRKQEVIFTLEDAQVFEKLYGLCFKNAKQPDGIMRVLYSLMFYCKKYSDNNRGEFYCTYQQIAKTSGIAYAKYISKYLTELNNYGLIKIITRNQYDKQSKSVKKLPNMYSIEIKEPSILNDKSFTVNDECDHLYELLYFFYKDNLHKVTTLTIRRNIKQLTKPK